MIPILTCLALSSVYPLVQGQQPISGIQRPVTYESKGGQAICVSGFKEVSASASNLDFDFGTSLNQSVITQLFVTSLAQGNSPLQFATGTNSVSGAYEIGVSLCVPKNGSSSPVVQLLSHGVGFDRTYWDFAPGYSYVDYAATQGYTTFLYDRIGTGASVHPDPTTIKQAPIQVEILAQLIRNLRNGTFGPTFDQVVGVGHSYGSIISQGVTNQYPSLFNAVIITGFTVNQTGQVGFQLGSDFEIASTNNPYEFGHLNPGYIVAASIISNQLAFFHAPGADPAIISLADASKQPTSNAELFSTPSIVRPSDQFTGPVAVVLGLEDLPFCTSNCSSPMNKANQLVAELYPNANTRMSGGASGSNNSNTYLVPNTGHGINLHYNAILTHEFMNGFLKSHDF